MANRMSFRTVLVMVMIVYGSTLVFRLFAFHIEQDGCSFLGSNVDCVVMDLLDPLHIEIVAIIGLAMLSLRIRDRGIRDFEMINLETRRIVAAIHRTVASQDQIQERRAVYGTQAIKNHLGSLLLCVGIAHRVLNVKAGGSAVQLDVSYADARLIISKIRHILRLSIDVLDPALVQQIEAFATMMEKDELPSMRDAKPLKYDDIKKEIMSLSELLSKQPNRVIK